MKKLALLSLLLFPWSFAWADTTTTNMGLTLPTTSQLDVWGAKINRNFQIIDASAALNGSGTSAFNVLTASQVFISTPTYPGTDKLAVNGQSTFFGSSGAILRLCNSDITSCTNLSIDNSNPSGGVNVSTMTITGMTLNTTGKTWIFGDQHSFFSGYGAGKSVGSSNNNTGIGDFSMGFGDLSSSASGNTGIGYTSLYHLSSGTFNTATGSNALFSNTTGYGNTANGYTSLNYLTTGTYNTALGYLAGVGDGTTQQRFSVLDTSMTFIGYQASRGSSISSMTFLTNGTAIGANAQVTSSNTIQLGSTGTNTVLAGYFQFFPQTKAFILASTPTATNQAYACSDCTTTPVCISTGTSNSAQWASMSSKTTACQ